MKEKSAEHECIPGAILDSAPSPSSSLGPPGSSSALDVRWDGDRPGSELWNRNFRLFFIARTAALFGDGMIPVALTAGLLGVYRPPSSVGFALAAWMGPLALFVLFGGVLADRFTRGG